MNIVLFLLVLDYGWVRVGNTYEDLEDCQATQDTFIEQHPDIIEGFCCHLTETSCLNLEVRSNENNITRKSTSHKS